MGGSRLDQVEGWATATRFSVGQSERAYLKASMEHRDNARRQEQVRRDHEASLERRSIRRLRGLVAVFAVAALVAGSLTIVATNQGDRAEREATIASARELVAASEWPTSRRLRSRHPAGDGGGRADPLRGRVRPSRGRGSAPRAVTASRIVLTLPGVTGPVAASVDGILATVSLEDPGTVNFRESSNGRIIRSIDAHEGRVIDLAFSPDGRVLATSGRDGALDLWNVADGGTRLDEG